MSEQTHGSPKAKTLPVIDRKNTSKSDKVVSKDGEKIPMFITMNDGKGYPMKIANLEHPLVCKRKGIIQIEAIKRSNIKQQTIPVRAVHDSQLNIWYGIPLGIDKDSGRIIWKSFTLGDFREYDLTKDSDAEEWSIVSRCKFLKGSPFQKGPLRYKMYNVEDEALKEIERISSIQESVTIAKNAKLKDWINICRFFGKTPEGMSAIMLQKHVYTIANENPVELVAYHNNENRELYDLFNAGKSIGVLSLDYTRGWMHNKSLPIGRNDADVIVYMTKNPEWTVSFKQLVESKDKASSFTRTSQANSDVNEEENEHEIDLRMKGKLHQIPGSEKMALDELKDAIAEKEKEAEEVAE